MFINSPGGWRYTNTSKIPEDHFTRDPRYERGSVRVERPGGVFVSQSLPWYYLVAEMMTGTLVMNVMKVTALRLLIIIIQPPDDRPEQRLDFNIQ